MPKAHPDGPHILLRREAEPGGVCSYLNKLRHLADAMCEMAAEMAEPVVGNKGTSDARDPA